MTWPPRPGTKGGPLAAVIALSAVATLPASARAQADRAAPPPQMIDPSWLRADTTKRTATFELIAGLTGLNGGLNFNGFRDGGLVLTVPLGWSVVLHFRNHDGMLPHSAEVVADTQPLPAGPVPPAFDRALTVRLAEGLTSEQTDDLRFIADKGGSYLIFCGVPGHGAAGMWIRLVVTDSARLPSLVTSPAGRS